MRFACLLALCMGASPAALAANAAHPYANIDHRNDAGNDTGDARVDALNAAQLDGAAGSRFVRGTATIYGRRATAGYPPGYAPRPVYYPPYYPPRPPYYAPAPYPSPGAAWPAPAYPY